MTPVLMIFGLLGVVVIVTALGMLLSRNAIYSALFLVLNFATVAVLYIILGAPFISLVQITVYAGSIMVMFLFVIMLLGAERLPGSDRLRRQRWIASILGLVFVAQLILFISLRGQLTAPIGTLPAALGSPQSVGTALFTKYASPFEVTGAILVVATVGAILLTRGAAVTRPPTRKEEEK